jgi:hypothetical protein
VNIGKKPLCVNHKGLQDFDESREGRSFILKIKLLSDKEHTTLLMMVLVFIMMKMNGQKSPEDILKQEFIQERAAVLGRAGEKVSIALEKLRDIEKVIEAKFKYFNQIIEKCQTQYDDGKRILLRRQAVKEINVEIIRFNRAREYAKLRYYYLIVTREAMGMHRHHWVEDTYKIPARKKHLRDE